jgi:hypothetical protein
MRIVFFHFLLTAVARRRISATDQRVAFRAPVIDQIASTAPGDLLLTSINISDKQR